MNGIYLLYITLLYPMGSDNPVFKAGIIIILNEEKEKERENDSMHLLNIQSMHKLPKRLYLERMHSYSALELSEEEI